MGTGPFGWLEDSARQRVREGRSRRLRPRGHDCAMLDLAGNDYLGLARHPRVTRAAAEAARRWGAGSTGSRLVTGDTTLHRQLEEELAAFCGSEAALVFSSGYAANMGVVTALAGGHGAHLVCDRNNHASLIDASRLAKAAGARVSLFEHRDCASAGSALANAAEPRRFLLSDTVFSVDGDRADVAGLARVCRADGSALLLDDAHGLGTLGPAGEGALEDAGLRGGEDVVTTVTLSKALGSQGGAVLGPRQVINHLVETSRPFIFDTGLAPPAVGSALAALRLLREQPWRVQRLRASASAFVSELEARGQEVGSPQAAVLSLHAPSPEAAVRWAERCRESGVRVGCFRPPSVPDGISRLRLTARADLGAAEVRHGADVIAGLAPH